MTTIIQPARRGVSDSLRSWFSPCPHGEKWYWEWDFGYADINFPNCPECHGKQSGQVAWRSNRKLPLDEAKRESVKALRNLTGQAYGFDDAVEAYAYHTEHELAIWPHIASDVFVTCASYDPDEDVIRHEPDGAILVRFSPLEIAPGECAEVAQKAADEYVKSHIQRMGELDAKGWFAWLLGEYIKDKLGHDPVRINTVIRSHTTT